MNLTGTQTKITSSGQKDSKFFNFARPIHTGKIRRARDPILLQTRCEQRYASGTKNSNNGDKESLIPYITELLSQFL